MLDGSKESCVGIIYGLEKIFVIYNCVVIVKTICIWNFFCVMTCLVHLINWGFRWSLERKGQMLFWLYIESWYNVEQFCGCSILCNIVNLLWKIQLHKKYFMSHLGFVVGQAYTYIKGRDCLVYVYESKGCENGNLFMKEFWSVLIQTTVHVESIIWIVIYDCRSLRERLTKIMFAKENWSFSYCSSFIRILHLHFLKIFQYDNLRNAYVMVWEWCFFLVAFSGDTYSEFTNKS
jgi:hypothetical protein